MQSVAVGFSKAGDRFPQLTSVTAGDIDPSRQFGPAALLLTAQ
jgi:hypothetical protein